MKIERIKKLKESMENTMETNIRYIEDLTVFHCLEEVMSTVIEILEDMEKENGNRLD